MSFNKTGFGKKADLPLARYKAKIIESLLMLPANVARRLPVGKSLLRCAFAAIAFDPGPVGLQAGKPTYF